MKSLHHAVAGLFLIAFAGASQQYTIFTFAGGAAPPARIHALDAVFTYPGGIATDSSGNVYFSSTGDGSNCIFEVDATGTLKRIAGSGRAGYSGDDGPANKAQLQDPSSLTFDAAGNLYFVDGNRIRMIDPSGIITTIAGRNGRMRATGDGGPAVLASLGFPEGLAADGNGNFYVTDGFNNLVRKIDSDGIITTVAGAGSGGFSGDGGPATQARLNAPQGIAVDAAGTIYVADTNNLRIRKITLDGTITTILDNSASGQEPDAIALDANGNIFVSGQLQIQEISSDGAVSTYARTPSSYGGIFPYPDNYQGLAVDAPGNLYLFNPLTAQIAQLSPSGELTVVAQGTNPTPPCDGCQATGVLLNHPMGLAMDQYGNVFIAENAEGRIREISPNGIITTVVKTPSPVGVAADSKGNVYFSDQYLNTVSKVSLQTGEVTVVAGSPTIVSFSNCLNQGGPGLATNARLCYPAGLALDTAGNLYIADSLNGFIRKVIFNGEISNVAGAGTLSQSANFGDGGPALAARLERPLAVALDRSGNIYIADTNNGRIRRVTTDGLISTLAGSCVRRTCTGRSLGDGGPATSAAVRSPTGIALDAAGNVYITDARARVRKVSSDGTITTIAGNGRYSYSGDGGPAAAASLVSPYAVVADAAGNIYISDLDGGAVRLLQP